jgi:hypothetical protein
MLSSGKRQPSLKTAKLIAIALRMGLQAFVYQLEVHAGMEKTHLKNPRPYRRKVKQSEITLDKVSQGV